MSEHEDPLSALHALYRQEIAMGVWEHSRRTPHCPTLPRFAAAISSKWEPEEEEHMVGCSYCQMVLVNQIEDLYAVRTTESSTGAREVLSATVATSVGGSRVGVGPALPGGGFFAELESILSEDQPSATKLYATILRGIADAHRAEGRFLQAVTHYRLAASYVSEDGSSQELAATFLSIAQTFLDWNRLREAVAWAELAIQILRLLPDPEDSNLLVQALALTGVVFGELGEQIEARRRHEEARELLGGERAPKEVIAFFEDYWHEAGKQFRDRRVSSTERREPGRSRAATTPTERSNKSSEAAESPLTHGRTSSPGRILSKSRLVISRFENELQARVERLQDTAPAMTRGYLATVLASMLMFAAAALLSLGHVVLAGIAIILSAPWELVDAELALRTKSPRRAVFVDYLSDRLGDMAILGAIAWSFRNRSPNTALLSLAVLGLTLLASYVRAQGAALGLNGATWPFGRALRMFVLIAGLLSGHMFAAMAFLAVLTVIIVLQRSRTVLWQGRAPDLYRPHDWEHLGTILQWRARFGVGIEQRQDIEGS
jgi:tetratricopeptide (TPR) repeat protein